MTQVPPPQQIFDRAVYNWMEANAIQAAAFYGIADLLQDGPKSVTELANATQTHPDSLYRLLRALAAGGIFAESNTEARSREEHIFAQTELSHFLCQDVPGSMYAMVRQFGSEWEHRSWHELTYSVRTGRPAFDHIFGKSAWEYFMQDRPDEGAIFNRSMRALSTLLYTAILQGYDFPGIHRLMDVGGGDGTLILALLQAHPNLHGVVFDQSPEATQSAVQSAAQAGLAERCKVFTGDFLTALPSVEVDACVLKQIMHDWDDESCVIILSNCRKILKPGDKLIIIDQVIPNSNPDLGPTLTDLEMLITNGGRERTEREYRTLIETSGFALKHIIPTASPVHIIESVAV